jgi:homoserine/homoserine lactone efflux protein
VALDTWLAFFAACWLISLSPGAGAISCMAAGLRYGFRRAFPNIVGLIAGIMFMLAIVIRTGAILAASSLAFAIVWLGVAYPVWPGLAQWRAPAFAVYEGSAGPSPAAQPGTAAQGFVNATNPKGVLFIAVLPQFIDPLRPQFLQYLLCGATLTLTDLVVMSGYTLFASRVLGLLREPHHIRAMNRTLGGLFVVRCAGDLKRKPSDLPFSRD